MTIPEIKQQIEEGKKPYYCKRLISQIFYESANESNVLVRLEYDRSKTELPIKFITLK